MSSRLPRGCPMDVSSSIECDGGGEMTKFTNKIQFFYGTTWHWPIPYLPRVMISASFLRDRKSKVKIDKPWMMDSGVGGMFKVGTRPRITLEEYVKIIDLQNPPIAWTYDYPCEPTIRTRYGYTPTEAQDKTNQNTIILKEKFGLNNVMSVVQGWSINDYLQNIDKIKEQGLLTERIGIGSICRRGQTKEIDRIIKAVHNNVPRWVKLHGFGVKTSVLNTEARFCLSTVDSSAWGIQNRHYTWTSNNTKGMTWHDKVPFLAEYVEKMENTTMGKATLDTYLTEATK